MSHRSYERNKNIIDWIDKYGDALICALCFSAICTVVIIAVYFGV